MRRAEQNIPRIAFYFVKAPQQDSRKWPSGRRVKPSTQQAPRTRENVNGAGERSRESKLVTPRRSIRMRCAEERGTPGINTSAGNSSNVIIVLDRGGDSAGATRATGTIRRVLLTAPRGAWVFYSAEVRAERNDPRLEQIRFNGLMHSPLLNPFPTSRPVDPLAEALYYSFIGELSGHKNTWESDSTITWYSTVLIRELVIFYNRIIECRRYYLAIVSVDFDSRDYANIHCHSPLIDFLIRLEY